MYYRPQKNHANDHVSRCTVIIISFNLLLMISFYHHLLRFDCSLGHSASSLSPLSVCLALCLSVCRSLSFPALFDQCSVCNPKPQINVLQGSKQAAGCLSLAYLPVDSCIEQRLQLCRQEPLSRYFHSLISIQRRGDSGALSEVKQLFIC